MTDPLDPDTPLPDPLNSPDKDTPPPLNDEPAQAQPQPQAQHPQQMGNLPFPALGQGTMSPVAEKTQAMLGHLLSLSGPPTAGLGYVVGPLLAFLYKKDESPFATEHSKESLNFGILTLIVIGISAGVGFTALPCVGWIPGGLALMFNLIFCIQGAIAAKDGRAFRYPFNWRIIK